MIRRPRRSAIWLAMVRFQIRSKSLNSSALSCSANRLGQFERMARRADRFVGFLGVLDLRLDRRAARSGRILARHTRDATRSPGGVDRHLGQVGRVGTHVGDVAVFVQALGDLHRPPGGEAELAVGFLLQRAGGERRRRARGVRLVFDLRDAKLAVAHSLDQFCGRCSAPAAAARGS